MLDSELSAVKRRALLMKAARQLRTALDGLKILQLPLEIAACHSDLAAVLMRVDPLLVEDALDFETRGLSAEITEARENAREASRTIFSLDSVIVPCGHLFARSETRPWRPAHPLRSSPMQGPGKCPRLHARRS